MCIRDSYNTSETRSNNNSYGLNYQKTGKELMSQDEIAVMDGAKCILQLRGVRRSEEHTSELQSLMRISYAVFCLTVLAENSLNAAVITSTSRPLKKTR